MRVLSNKFLHSTTHTRQDKRNKKAELEARFYIRFLEHAGASGKEKSMSRIKWFTQRFAGLSLIALFLGLPLGLTKLMQAVGLISAIDALYPSTFFWVAFIATRLAFGALWFGVFFRIWFTAEVKGYFWVKPKKSWEINPAPEPESPDLTPYIVGAPFLCAIIVIFAEFAIRVYTFTMPPFSPPPTN